jgi:hypothetical protein
VSVIDWLNANAGAVTAAATTIYAIVTLFLAREARRARIGAAAASHKAEAALREERELNVMPYLATEMIASWQPDGSLDLQIGAVNYSEHPALRVTVKLLHGPWDRLPPNDPGAEKRLLRDTPRFYAVVPPKVGAKRFRWTIPASDVPEVTIVRMRYLGPLGGITWQTIELGRRPDDRWSFLDLQRFVLSSVPGAEPIITEG